MSKDKMNRRGAEDAEITQRQIRIPLTLLKVLNSEGSVGNMNFVESALRRAQILIISKFVPAEFPVLNRV